MPFYPLREELHEQDIKDGDIKDEDATFYFDPNVALSKFNSKKKEQILRESLTFLKKYFDPDSSIELISNLYEKNKEKTLLDFIKTIGRIIILVDDKYLKHVAKLLNKRLEEQYYDVYDMSNLSYKELLQDIYSNPSNPNFDNLEEIIRKNIDRFSNIFLSCLRFNYIRGGYSDFSDCVNKKSQEENPDVVNILNLEGIDQCNIEYKNRKVFEKYNKAKEAFDKVDQNDVLESLNALTDLQKEYNAIKTLIKNIIYYKDEDEGQLYCFDYNDLEQRFLMKNYKNPYTDKKFSDQFIDDFYIVASKKSLKSVKEKIRQEEQLKKKDLGKVKKEHEEEEDLKKEFEQTDFSLSIFSKINSLELTLIDTLPKETTCEYYNKYIFNKEDSLEKLMKKSQEDLDRMKAFCGDIKAQQEPSQPSQPSQPSKPKGSLPSLPTLPSLQEDKVSKKKASLPIISDEPSAVQSSQQSVVEPPSVDQSSSSNDVEDQSVLQPLEEELSEEEKKKLEKRRKIEALSKNLTMNL